MHDHRVYRAAGVVDHRPRGDRDGAGLGIDLELADLTAVREREGPILWDRPIAETSSASQHAPGRPFWEVTIWCLWIRVIPYMR
jgi:hypothetical protein